MIPIEIKNKILEGLVLLGHETNRTSREHGFWETPKLYEDLLEHMITEGTYTKADFDLLTAKFQRNHGEALMLMVSELAEEFEAARKGKESEPSEHIPDFTAREEEFADVAIRLFEYARGCNVNLAAAVIAKMDYNESRPYKHGKKF